MKKVCLLFFAIALCLSSYAQYVDLGLPSGTLWKDKNEEGGLYTFEQALARFGNNLPNRDQLEELRDSCTWTWNGKGYNVVGPNGNSIFLPANGFRDCGWEWHGTGLDPYSISVVSGSYWSSIRSGADAAYSLCFNANKVFMSDYGILLCSELSVRLVVRNNKEN